MSQFRLEAKIIECKWSKVAEHSRITAQVSYAIHIVCSEGDRHHTHRASENSRNSVVAESSENKIIEANVGDVYGV